MARLTLIAKRKSLSGSQILPGVAVNFHLKHSTFIRVEEVLAVRDAMGGLGANLAASPARRPDAATMKVLPFDHLETKFDAVPNTRRTGGY
jgi:hypothetical protein